MTKTLLTVACAAFFAAGCTGASNAAPETAAAAPAPATVATGDPALPSAPASETPMKLQDGKPFTVRAEGQFAQPWAMAFLPDGRLLVSEKAGALKLHALGGATGTVTGVPTVDFGGQGGFGDIALHPDFAKNGWLYYSYVEAGDGDARGAVVARAKLVLDRNGGGALSGNEIVWRQAPKVAGRGHFSHRIVFGPDGHLWISSGERQKFTPAQDMATNLGKVLRLNDDGSVPADNPFVAQGGVAAQVWSLGHRNVLGLAFDAQGRLWESEMGPKGGDEVNLIERGANYGWPVVSNGDNYDGTPIPDHPARPEFNAPEVSWNPSISPSGLLIYSGDRFPQWKGDGFIGGLSSKAILRIEFDATSAKEAARYDMGARIREIEQGPDGSLWVLEDQEQPGGPGGRLLQLTPVD